MKNKKLISLEEANAKAFHDEYYEMAPVKNGIECPICKEELWDTNPMLILTSSPAQKNVHCDKCGYRGYRYC